MRQRAFSLIELILVIFLLGLILAFVFPDLKVGERQRALPESADRLQALIIACRAQAIADGREYRLEFPGAPDPLDRMAKTQVNVPVETQPPIVKWQSDPTDHPEFFEDHPLGWEHEVLQADRDKGWGVRCVAVYCGKPSLDTSGGSPIAGTQKYEKETTLFQLTFHTDGTCTSCDEGGMNFWTTFVLTDLSPEEQENIKPEHLNRIVHLVVDGRLGQVWQVRAFRAEEAELLVQHGADDYMFRIPLKEQYNIVISEDRINKPGKPVGTN